MECTEYLFGARYCVKSFTNIFSFDPYNNPMRLMAFLSLSYGRGNGGSGKSSDKASQKVTELIPYPRGRYLELCPEFKPGCIYYSKISIMQLKNRMGWYTCFILTILARSS